METNNLNDKLEHGANSSFHLGEIWHTFVIHLVWEILLFVIIMALGFAYSTTVKDSYVASAKVIVKAQVDEEHFGPENTSLSQQIAPYIKGFVGDKQVNTFITTQYGIDLSGSTQSATLDDENSILMTISYSHSIKEVARKGVIEYIKYFDKYLQDTSPFEELAVVSLSTTVTDMEVVAPTVRTISSRNKILLLTFVVAVAGVVAFVSIAMIVGDKVSNVSRLEAVTGKKNLISVGRIISKNKTKTSDADNKLVSLKLDKLSDTLIFMQDGENNKIFQIQSTYAEEGKTTVTCNLAKAIGRSQRKVLILDCDFAHPSVHKFLELPRELGLSDYAKKTANLKDIIKPTKFENVDLITCGDMISNHTVMFTSPAFATILKEARAKYDFVLLDCAPVKAMSDYISVSSLVDATLVVVESDKVKSKDLASAVNELNTCGANVVGTVFNCSKVSNSKYYYYYYHRKHTESEEAKETVETITPEEEMPEIN